MASHGGDALLKRVLAGLLAAGGGAAIYFGYKKWANRALTAGDGKPDDASTGKVSTYSAHTHTHTRTHANTDGL